MNDAAIGPSRDRTAAIDLSACEREPIHIPGAIQPHGAVLAAVAGWRLVSHASANLAAILGRPAPAVLGKPLAEVIGAAACHALLDQGSYPGTTFGHVHTVAGPQGGLLHLRAFRSGRHIVIDIEPESAAPRLPIATYQAIVETFTHAGGPSSHDDGIAQNRPFDDADAHRPPSSQSQTRSAVTPAIGPTLA